MDANGKGRWRLEGYLPKEEFSANLEMGLARVAFMNKDWADAERRYTKIIEHHPDSKFAPEAVYWQGVSHYKATNDHEILSEVAETFKQKYQDSIWALKSLPWSH
jgi:TolA-binding protein